MIFVDAFIDRAGCAAHEYCREQLLSGTFLALRFTAWISA
jgi:hypothetical protein